ncbi:hypothetical protein QVD17_13237 [Tagetes erecta]|uniref:F-box domain-containing protein n=1 Tax=Tagetes erecta TaxID=13708 RepID=A0AAD8L377_TARER|nr:hypothetical protein QVD17_13237 [Tagetes erecta]
MKNNDQSHEEDAATNSSSINQLPDEIILQILNKLIDLKTLCICHLVSKRFSSIILQIDTISFIAPLITTANSDNNTSGDFNTKNLFWSLINGAVFKPINLLRRIVLPYSKPLPPIISSFYGDSFRSAVSFLSKFRSVKSLSIELPCSNHKGIDHNCLFKWNAVFGTRIESFMFLSPNGVYVNTKFEEMEENNTNMDGIEPSIDSFKRKVHIAFQCLKDVIVRHRMLLYFIKDHLSLEKVSISDSGRRGRLCLSGGRLAEVREWIHSSPDDAKLKLNRIEVPVNVNQCYVPVLKLPVSGCVMKGVTFVVMRMNNVEGENGCFVNVDDVFEDDLEAAYSEAVMEILENHQNKMKRLL